MPGTHVQVAILVHMVRRRRCKRKVLSLTQANTCHRHRLSSHLRTFPLLSRNPTYTITELVLALWG